MTTNPLTDQELHHVSLWLCDLCLDGKGGECHVPGCALWMNRAPDVPIRDKTERLGEDYWRGLDDALTAVEEGQQLYGTTRKAVAALRVVSRIGRTWDNEIVASDDQLTEHAETKGRPL